MTDTKRLELYIKALNHTDRKIRYKAALGLGKFKEPIVGEALIVLLRRKDEDAEVRWAAVCSIGELGYSRAYKILLAMVGDRWEDPKVRLRAVESLGTMKFETAAVPLTQALQKGDMELKKSAAIGLIKLHLNFYRVHNTDLKATEGPLLEALLGDDLELAIMAGMALGVMGSIKAIPALLELLEEDVALARYYSALSLACIADTWVGFQAMPQPKETLTAVEPLLKLLQDPDEEVRTAAAHALGLIGDWRAIKPMNKYIKKENEPLWKMVINSLEPMRDGESIRSLAGMARELIYPRFN